MAVTDGVSPVYKGGAPRLTMAAAAAITAGTLVEISSSRTVQTATAASVKCVGVALQTCTAAADLVAVDTSGVHLLTASGAITAGDLVQVATGGKVSTVAAVVNTNAGTVATGVTDTRSIVGVALEDIADTAKGRVLLKVAG